MSDRRRSRCAMTLVETLIAVLVGFTVMMVTFALFRSTGQLRDKTSQMNAATQAAAQFFYALESDIANIRASDDADETFAIIDEEFDPNATPGTKQLKLFRANPLKGLRMDWGAFDYKAQKKTATKIEYFARKDDKTNLYELSRTVQVYDQRTGAEIHTTENFFRGAWAKDVRFSMIEQPRSVGGASDWFLRVSLLMVGDVVNEKLQSVNQAPEVLLTTLYKMPVFPAGAVTEPLQ